MLEPGPGSAAHYLRLAQCLEHLVEETQFHVAMVTDLRYCILIEDYSPADQQQPADSG